jgi:hypothetical protein
MDNDFLTFMNPLRNSRFTWMPVEIAYPGDGLLDHDGTGAVMADTADRRAPTSERSMVLKRELNESQLATLNTLERFGWQLKFVRRECAAKTAVLFDPDAKRYALLGRDGNVNENPIFEKFR